MSDLVHWIVLWLTIGFLAAVVAWKRVYSGGYLPTRWWLLTMTLVSGPIGWWVMWPTLSDEDQPV